MKISKIMLAGVFLLAILTLGTASAVDADAVGLEDDSVEIDIPAEIDDAASSVEVEMAPGGDEMLGVVESDDVEDNNQDVLQDNNTKKDVELQVNMPSEISSSDLFTSYIKIENNESIRSYYEFFVDGETMFNITDDFCLGTQDKFNSLSYGIHSWGVRFPGNDDYNPAFKNGTFEYTYVCIDFPKSVAGNGEFNIRLPDGVGSYYCLYINDVLIFKKYYEGNFDVRLPELEQYGILNYTLTFLGNDVYPAKTFRGSFENRLVDLINPSKVIYGQNNNIGFSSPSEIVKDLKFIMNGKTYTSTDKYNAVLSSDAFKFGKNIIKVKYPGSSKYPAMEYSFVVNCTAEINFEDTVQYGDNLLVSLTLPSDASGKLVAMLEGHGVIQESDFTNGKATLSIPSQYFIGDFMFLTVMYDGTDYYVKNQTKYIEFTPKITLPNYKENRKYLLLEFPSDANGTLSIIMDGSPINGEIVNGTAKFDLSQYLKKDTCPQVIISYDGNYPSVYRLYQFNYGREVPKYNMTVSTAVAGSPTTIKFELPKDYTDSILISDAPGYPEYAVVKPVNGKASIKITFPNSGTYRLTAITKSTNYYYDTSFLFDVVVLPGPKIVAGDSASIYSSSSVYKVQVFNKGKVASKVAVTFKIDGKKVITTTTDKNGYATLKINKLPGTYKITTVALGKAVTKKLTVKHVVTLKTVAVKKSAGKLILQANLAKVNGKYLAGKIVTFKFNGKTIKAKTNSKGVAKATVSKAILSKLVVGGKITYQATYLKDTVKKTVKVAK